MKKSIIIMIIALVVGSQICAGCFENDSEKKITWETFIKDFVDTDDDGERDDFKSYDINDTVIIRDKIIELGVGGGIYSNIKFKSYPNEEMIFYGDANNVNIGDNVEVKIKIIKGTEDDNDEREYYSAEEIRYSEN